MNNRDLNKGPLITQFGQFMTIQDIMSAMKIGRKKADSLVKTGQLPGSKAAGDFRIKTTDFIKWWDRNVVYDQQHLLKFRSLSSR